MINEYKLRDLCSTEITDGTHQTPTYVSDGYIFLSSKNVTTGVIDWDNVMYIPEELHNDLYKRVQPQINDILLAKNGTTGIAAIVDEPRVFDIYVSLALIRPDMNKVLPRYLLYALNSPRSKQYFDNSLKGIGVPNLHLSQIRETMIRVPSFDEQHKIVVQIDKICCLISLRKKQLQKLDDLVKARFFEMFGEGFQEETLLSLCNIIDYRGKTPEKVDKGLPFITAKNIRMHYMSMELHEYITKETYDRVMVRGFPKEGDVVFTTEAPLGNVCRIPHFDTEFYIGQRIVTLQTDILEPIYLEYALDTDDFKQKLNEKSSGSTVTGIRVRLLEQLTIPVPPREQQKRFADFVSQSEKSRLSIQQSLEKLEALKQSLMQQYFG